MTRINTTKMEIVRTATRMFLEKGVSATSAKNICNELGISTGNLTFYYPTKDHILLELVGMLCDFQWKMMEEEANEGYSSIMAICLELAAMVAICEEDEVAKDFYISAYSSPLCLERIRKNDAERAKKVFKDYRPDWSDEQFAEAEILVSGTEYATLITVGDPVSVETRIGGALHMILSTFNLPEELRKAKIARVLSMDYRRIGRRVLQGFRNYVEQANEQAFAALLQS